MGRGVKPGLERIEGMLDVLGNPHRGYPVVHVGGTNGKTSTVRMVAELVSAHGLTPGTFTSPHLQAVEQRYEFGLAAMTRDEFAAIVADVAPIADLFESRHGEGLTYFELTAAIAFAWLAERAVDVAVVEVGLGGRLDATNAASAEVAVVTTVGLDHTEYLGSTLAEIAAEKLAILDPGAALVTGHLDSSAGEVAERRVAETGGKWYRRGVEFDAVDVRWAGTGWLFDIRSAYGDYDDIELHLHGAHQVENFVTALAATEALFERSLDEAGVRDAAAHVTTPGRMEIVAGDPAVMLDGAHNPHAVEALAASLRAELPGLRWSLVMGIMGDKDIDVMLRTFEGLVVEVHAAAVDSPRAMSAAEVAAEAARVLGVPATPYDSVADAVAGARASGGPVLVSGSLYVVGEARTALGL